MKFLTLLLYIILIPIVLYMHLFFANLSLISVLLILSVFLFRDLKLLHYWWFLLIVSVLLDYAMYYWIGTFLLSIVVTLFFLHVWDRYVSNIFLDVVGVFFAFVLFKLFLHIFVSLQESFTLDFWSFSLVWIGILFGLINICVYLIIRGVDYILQSYFRNDGFKV